MVTINLLSWREKQARYEKHVLLYMALSSAVCALVILVCGDRYLFVQQQVAAEQLEHLKKELIWRAELVKHLQRHETPQQDSIVNFFRLLNESNAREVCFEQIKKSKSGVEFIGLASSSEQLAAFLQASSLTAYFAEVKVNQLEQRNGQLKFNFVGKIHAI